MRSRILSALALLAIAGAAAYAQNDYTRPGPAPVYDPPRPTPVVQDSPPVVITSPAPPVPVGNTPRVAPAPQPPRVPAADLPFDELLKELEATHAQKTAIAKREAEVVAEVRRRMGQSAETLRRLGHAPGDSTAPDELIPLGPRVSPATGRTPGAPDATTPRGRIEMVPYTESAPAPRPESAAPSPTGRKRSPAPPLSEPAR